MSEIMEQKARELAAQPYHVVISREDVEAGKQVFFLSYLELPGCVAQGETLEEAKAELEEVAYEYILGYLEDGVPVPAPYTTSQTTGGISVPIDGETENPAVERTNWNSSGHMFAEVKVS